MLYETLLHLINTYIKSEHCVVNHSSVTVSEFIPGFLSTGYRDSQMFQFLFPGMNMSRFPVKWEHRRHQQCSRLPTGQRYRELLIAATTVFHSRDHWTEASNWAGG